MTAEELFSASFQGDYEDEQPWEAVRALRQRDTDQVFHMAAEYSRSGIPIRRARALDVLAQLGGGKHLEGPWLQDGSIDGERTPETHVSSYGNRDTHADKDKDHGRASRSVHNYI